MCIVGSGVSAKFPMCNIFCMILCISGMDCGGYNSPEVDYPQI